MTNAPARTSVAQLAFADNARIIGIGLAVLQHFIGLAVVTNNGGVFRAAAYFGTLGVALLFVLSGYLLSGPYLRAILDDGELPNLRDFYVKRFLRIYPLFAFAVVAIGVLNFVDGKQSHGFAQCVLGHLSLAFNFSQRTVEQVESPMWTMAVDAQFYLVLPLVAGLFWMFTRNRTIAEKKAALWTFLGSVALVSVIVRFIVMIHEPQSASNFAAQIVHLKQLPEMGGAFAIGVAVALFERDATISRRTLFLIAGIALAIAHAASRFVLKDPRHVLAYAAGFATYDAIAALAAGLILLGLPRVCENRFFVALASVSYAVYLFHLPLLGLVANTTHVHGFARTVVLAATFAFVVIPVSWAAHRFVEEPFLKMKSRVGTRGVPEVAVAVAVATGS